MVRITDECICCDNCIDECPTQSIVTDEYNPENDDFYFVQGTCTECVNDFDSPACAEVCPVQAFVWGKENYPSSAARTDTDLPVIGE